MEPVSRRRPGRRADAPPERIRVHLDDGSSFEVALEAVEAGGLAAGDPVDEALRAVLADADLRWRAREAALSLLSYRPRSRSELAGRLRKKDFPGPVIATCLDALEASGLVDDGAFARAYARDRLKRGPTGRKRLHADLRKRGVGDDVAREAVDEVFRDEGLSEAELVEAAARGWLARQSLRVKRELAAEPFRDEHQRARRRLYGYLARRGFRGAQVVRAMEAARRRAQDEVDDVTG